MGARAFRLLFSASRRKLPRYPEPLGETPNGTRGTRVIPGQKAEMLKSENHSFEPARAERRRPTLSETLATVQIVRCQVADGEFLLDFDKL